MFEECHDDPTKIQNDHLLGVVAVKSFFSK